MQLLIIEDEHALAAALSTVARRLGAEPQVAASGQSGITKLAKHSFDLIVLDIGLPDMNGLEVLARIRQAANTTPVLIITAHGSLENALEATRLGASDYFLKPLDLAEFQQALRAFMKPVHSSVAEVASPSPPAGTVMIGAAPAMQRAYATIAQACGTHAPVLVSGASGTGKSLVARVIHANSSPRSGFFVSFRCDEHEAARLPQELLGAGSDGTGGAFGRAINGTLFIEEIAALPLITQAGLLRALDHAEEKSRPRVIAATAKDLLEETRAGRFREDLYYRLKIVEVVLPPLAARTEDIPALAAFFLGQAVGTNREATLSDATLACLKSHLWPGNVRELRHAMQHAAAVCAGPLVLPRHLPESISRNPEAVGGGSHLEHALDESLARWLDRKLTASEAALPPYDELAAQVEALMLRRLLPRFDHKPTRLAAALNMNRATLRRKCRQAGIAEG